MTLDCLHPGTEYHYRIWLRDPMENELVTSDYMFTTDPDIAPPVPSGVNIQARDEELVVSWNSLGTTDLAGYRVYRSLDDSIYDPVSAVQTDSVFYDRFVNNGVTYFYRITAVDVHGNESAESSTASGSPRAPQPPRCKGLNPVGRDQAERGGRTQNLWEGRPRAPAPEIAWSDRAGEKCP